MPHARRVTYRSTTPHHQWRARTTDSGQAGRHKVRPSAEIDTGSGDCRYSVPSGMAVFSAGRRLGLRWRVRGSWMGSFGSLLSPINGLVQSPNRVPYRPQPFKVLIPSPHPWNVEVETYTFHPTLPSPSIPPLYLQRCMQPNNKPTSQHPQHATSPSPPPHYSSLA